MSIMLSPQKMDVGARPHVPLKVVSRDAVGKWMEEAAEMRAPTDVTGEVTRAEQVGVRKWTRSAAGSEMAL
jgi:hypothetical protein